MHSKYSIHHVDYGQHKLVLHLLLDRKMKNVRHEAGYVERKDRLCQQYCFE